MTNDGGGSGAPRFDVVLRGYDRRQVDEHVARMQHIIGRMRADLEQARSQPLPIVQPVAGMPIEKSPVEQNPVEQNNALPAPRPHPGDSPDVVGSFTDRMQSILQSAEDEAAEIRKKAHASARSELQAARAEVADLARQRDVMITELSRMRGQLESMLSGPTARLGPVTRSGGPSTTRRDGKPRPSPTPRAGATPSPVPRQAATGPQQVSVPPPEASTPDAATTKAAPTVTDEPAPAGGTAEPTPKPSAPKTGPPATNGADSGREGSDGKPAEAPPTVAVQVTGEPRGKVPSGRREGEKPAEPARPAAGEQRPVAEATVQVAAVRPEKERSEADRPAEAEAGSSSRSG